MSRNHQSPLCGFTKFFHAITGFLSLTPKTPSWVNLHLRWYHSKALRKNWVASWPNLPNSRNVPKSSKLFLWGWPMVAEKIELLLDKTCLTVETCLNLANSFLWPKKLGICDRIFFWCKFLMPVGQEKTLLWRYSQPVTCFCKKIIKRWKFSENGTFCYKFSFFWKTTHLKGDRILLFMGGCYHIYIYWLQF